MLARWFLHVDTWLLHVGTFVFNTVPKDLNGIFRAYDSMIIFSDVSIDILARNKFSLLTHPECSTSVCTANKRMDLEAHIFCKRTQFDKKSLRSDFFLNCQKYLTYIFLTSKIRIEYLEKFIRDFRANVLIYRIDIAIANVERCTGTLDCHICIWPWPILKVKVKVMHTSRMNVSQTATDKANIAIGSK